ncbi:hypothetical protein V6N11_045002 [Hibiscus sabdariffa]|uniref:Uncharacterized protein n=1 Tax=Hibiscus sabdariffa TaxID=183260 RepID=A0ABR2PUJ7_9ROSI
MVQPKQILGTKDFLLTTRRKDAHSIKIKKRKDVVKFKVLFSRCSRVGRHHRDSGGPFDEPRLPIASSFPSLPPSCLGFDHPRPQMSQIGTGIMWLVRSASSLFNVATVSDLRCCSSGSY